MVAGLLRFLAPYFDTLPHYFRFFQVHNWPALESRAIAIEFLWVNLLESNHLEDQAGDGRIMHWIWVKLGVKMRNFMRWLSSINY
jgi:hypothetical protein